MPSSSMRRLARTRRWAIVSSLTRNARVISAVLNPLTALSVRRNAPVGRQCGMAAGEDHGKLVVIECVVVSGARRAGFGLRCLGSQPRSDDFGLAFQRCAAPQLIDCFIAGCATSQAAGSSGIP